MLFDGSAVPWLVSLAWLWVLELALLGALAAGAGAEGAL